MKEGTLNAKLLKCFFALALVTGLCVPAIGSSAYGTSDNDVVFTEVNDVMQEGGQQSDGQGGQGDQTESDGDGANVPDGAQDGEDGQGDTGEGDAGGQPADDQGNGDGDLTLLLPANNALRPDAVTASGEEEATAEDGTALLSDEGIAPLAADSAVGGLTISGGTVNTDFTHATNLVVVKTSTPLTLSGTFTGSVQIQAGVHAHLILNGVTITGNSTSSPVNLMASSQAHITLVDGTTNTLNANQQGCAALHCGYGSTLYIDDQLVNFDSAGDMSSANHVGVDGGVVANDGFVTDAVTGQKTAVKAGDILPKITSANPGILIAYGGSFSSGIGSGPNEIAGTMIFDGGDIRSYSWGGHSANHGNSAANDGVTNAMGVDNGGSSGTGIGAGAGGTAGASEMVFNAATIHAYGSYHGAGIGAGWQSNGTATARQTGASTTGPASLNKNCGNITINGGYLLSQGYAHGNAFGGACGTNLNNNKIRITGGTLLPYSHTSRCDIGGTGGDVIISGGSIRLSGTQASKFQLFFLSSDISH